MFSRRIATRMPFRFGTATMTDLEAVYVRVELETADGRSAFGTGASVLSPMWFDKNPNRTLAARRNDLLLSIRLARDAYVGRAAPSAFALHELAQRVVLDRCRGRGLGLLAAGFGIALFDGAVVDALCRLDNITLHEALARDRLGFGAIRGLPDAPSETLEVRHTVGLSDPILPSDVTSPLDDGLPESLAQVVRRYGHRFFKIKIGPDVSVMREWLRRITEVLDECVAGQWCVTLDGNESFQDMTQLGRLVTELATRRDLQPMCRATMWIEQPLPRDLSLSRGILAGLGPLHPKIVLDESDATDQVVGQALALGYGGISAKNCKGIYRTLHSFRTLEEWNRQPRRNAVLSGEDLTNPGVYPFHQDTCVMASLGVPHVERNAHHYVRGQAHLTERERANLLREFPSLYERCDNGLVTLKIRDGRISTKEIVASGYGTISEPDWEALTPLRPGEPC